jgi:hypothetical protein
MLLEAAAGGAWLKSASGDGPIALGFMPDISKFLSWMTLAADGRTAKNAARTKALQPREVVGTVKRTSSSLVL